MYLYYLRTLSVAWTVTGVSYSAVVFGLCGISARMISARELEMICSEVFMAQSRYTLAFDWRNWGELRRAEDSQCSGQDSNCAPPNHKTSALLLHQITGRMFSSLWKEVVLVWLEVLLWHRPGVTGANHKKIWSSGWDFIPRPPRHGAWMLP